MCFCVQVTYSTDEFIVKNKDAVIAEHFDLLSGSSDAQVAALFPREKQGVKNKFFSLGNSFKVGPLLLTSPIPTRAQYPIILSHCGPV